MPRFLSKLKQSHADSLSLQLLEASTCPCFGQFFSNEAQVLTRPKSLDRLHICAPSTTRLPSALAPAAATKAFAAPHTFISSLSKWFVNTLPPTSQSLMANSKGITRSSEDSSELVFLLVENYSMDILSLRYFS